MFGVVADEGNRDTFEKIFSPDRLGRLGVLVAARYTSTVCLPSRGSEKT